MEIVGTVPSSETISSETISSDTSVDTSVDTFVEPVASESVVDSRFRAKAIFTGGCRWCDGEIRKPRRTFCSELCVHEYRLRSSGSYVRECVYARDKGRCGICEFETPKLARKMYALTTATKGRGRKRVVCKENEKDYSALCTEYNISTKRKVWGRKYGGGLWDADHILPVQFGGGECGLDNYRTLCIACHKAITWSTTLMSAVKSHKQVSL